MTEIEDNILIDDWKSDMSDFLSIDKPRINFIEFEGAGLVLTFTITENNSDNIDDLFKYIDDNYSQISEKRKNVYQPPYKRNKTYTPPHFHRMPHNDPSIKNYNCSICNVNYKAKEYLGSEPKCFKCRNVH